MPIRDLTSDDLTAVWAINQANTPAVGDVTLERLSWIVEMSIIALVATAADGSVVGFCLVLPPGTEYPSQNYRWFADRHERFVYLDRVAVDERARGGGVGAALYAEVERRARAETDAELFTLEVNLRPRNDGSLRFHAREGFSEVGQQETDYGVLVSLMAKSLR